VPARDPRLLRIASGLAEMAPQVAAEWEGLHAAPPVRLTRAHVAALDVAARRMALRLAGALAQLGSAEAESLLTAWAADLAATHTLTWLPVPTQVDLQTESVLTAARLLLP
jgi:hypothetical protein